MLVIYTYSLVPLKGEMYSFSGCSLEVSSSLEDTKRRKKTLKLVKLVKTFTLWQAYLNSFNKKLTKQKNK